MRGLPGSGKSTWARSLAKRCSGSAQICSADDYFIRDGQYKFDPRGLTSAHASCLTKFLDAMLEGTKCIIVDNTNTKRWEYANYDKIGRIAGYAVHVVEFACPTEADAVWLNSRNSHGVPVHASVAMWRRWEKDASGEQVPIVVSGQASTKANEAKFEATLQAAHAAALGTSTAADTVAASPKPAA